MSAEKRQEEMLKKVEAGLRRAALTARERGRKYGTPVWVWEGGEWVDANAEAGPRYERKEAEPAQLREEPEKPSDS